MLIRNYCLYMHEVDVVDQMRKFFGVDLSHRTGKWTVRFGEVLQSFLLGEGYNIHRHLHAANPQKRHSHHQFKVSVTRGLLSHPIVRHANSQNEHRISLHEPGSRGDEDGRRKVTECRQCPRFVGLIRNRQRRTPYYCNKCEVGLHPECFGAYHAERGLFFSPSPGGRKRNRANRDEV